jgi:hypothetical protein
LKQLTKTFPSDTSQETSENVIAPLSFKKPETSLFPCTLNFPCPKEAAICWAKNVTLLNVIEGHAMACVICDEGITDERSDRYRILSEARSPEAAQLKVGQLFAMKFDFDDFRHPTNAPNDFK